MDKMLNLQGRLAYSISEFCKLTSIGRSRAYEEMRTKRLRVVKCGRRTLVPAKAALEWLARLENQDVKT